MSQSGQSITSETRLATPAETDRLRAQMHGRVDPQSLIAAAIEKGAPIETLERLVQLAKDVRQVTAREAYFEAMAQFKRECPRIKKDATANAGQYSYNYATLDGILDVVDPLLGKVGLTVSWKQKHEGQAVHASCIVTHKLGHQEESGFIAIPFESAGRMNPAQRVGSAATYAKRYSLLAILGLAPEDDDDARGAADHVAKAIDPPLVRTDPEDHRAESERLFPDPEREDLLTKIKAIADKAKVGPRERAELWNTHVGPNVTPDVADVAALHDLLRALETRPPK